MTRTLLLFDIDGTILRTQGAGMRAMAVAARQLFGQQFKWDGVMAGGSLDPLIFADAAALNGMSDATPHHEAFRRQYLQQLPRELEASADAVEVMPGVLEVLATLRRRAAEAGDVVLGLLTGNYTEAVPIKLGYAGIDPGWFSVTAFGDEAPSRADLVALAMRKYERLHGYAIHRRRVVVIGDTHRDVECAKAHGCVSFAVATGPFDASHLRRAGADVVVENLADPSPLLALLP